MKKVLLITILFIGFFLPVSLFAKNYAIIIQGWPSNSVLHTYESHFYLDELSESVYDCFWNDTFLMWETLYKLGFKDENIFVLYGNYTENTNVAARYRPDGHGFDRIVDYSAYRADVQNIFNWLKDGNAVQGIPQITSEDFLFIYTFNHGYVLSGQTVCLRLMGGYDMPDYEFAALANQLPYAKRVVWMAQCNSGGFIDDLEDDYTVIATSSPWNDGANSCDDINPDGDDAVENEVIDGRKYHHSEFNYHMFNAANLKTIVGNLLDDPDTDNNGKCSIYEMFEWTDFKNSRAGDYPQYSDNGNIGSSTYLDVAPSTPENFQVVFTLNQNPVLTWDANNEYEIKYRIYKKYTSQCCGVWTTSVLTTGISYTDTYFIANYKVGEDQVEYWIVAEDNTGNVSGETQHISGDGIGPVWKNTSQRDNEKSLFSYKLSQNFPNPFNPSTVIEYSIPEKALVKLKVYDILGNEVQVLVDDIKEKGNHRVKFITDGLGSGIYIYIFQADEFFESKRMILIK